MHQAAETAKRLGLPQRVDYRTFQQQTKSLAFRKQTRSCGFSIDDIRRQIQDVRTFPDDAKQRRVAERHGVSVPFRPIRLRAGRLAERFHEVLLDGCTFVLRQFAKPRPTCRKSGVRADQSKTYAFALVIRSPKPFGRKTQKHLRQRGRLADRGIAFALCETNAAARTHLVQVFAPVIAQPFRPIAQPQQRTSYVHGSQSRCRIGRLVIVAADADASLPRARQTLQCIFRNEERGAHGTTQFEGPKSSLAGSTTTQRYTIQSGAGVASPREWKTHPQNGVRLDCRLLRDLTCWRGMAGLVSCRQMQHCANCSGKQCLLRPESRRGGYLNTKGLI